MSFYTAKRMEKFSFKGFSNIYEHGSYIRLWQSFPSLHVEDAQRSSKVSHPKEYYKYYMMCFVRRRKRDEMTMRIKQQLLHMKMSSFNFLH